MSFSSYMLIGLTIGIGIIAAFARYTKVRSSRRFFLASTISSFARMTVADSRKILPPDFYPPWVVFSQHQKLAWLNLQLNKIWPYVDEAASELILNTVEPILEQYTPSILSSMKFGRLTLGTVAPQFTGVSILESESGDEGITMEMEVQWDGNPDIILDINTRFGVSLPVQVKDIGFTGVFRLIFKPLVNEFPCFGAVSFSLREKKDLDFTLRVIGGDISAIPGVSEAIEDTIRDAIEDSLIWPVRQIIPILPGDYSDLELKPVGTLEVKLVQAKELRNKDIIGKSDPFAVLFVRPIRDRMKTSKTINNQLNPIWNEQFDFVVEDVSTQHLTVRIYDREGVQSAELIGAAQVALKDIEPGKVKDVWLKLVKDLVIQRDSKQRGQLHLELLYCPSGTENRFMNPSDPDLSLTSLEKVLKNVTVETDTPELQRNPSAKLERKRSSTLDRNRSSTLERNRSTTLERTSTRKRDVIYRGVLSVMVISAENLPATDFMGKADPFVVLSMKKSKSKGKTRVANETLNPVWNQTFDFVVEDALHEMLVVEVYDHDTFKKDKMGKCIMTLTRVLTEGEVEDSFPLDGTKSGKLFLHLKWSPQLVFRGDA